MPDFLRLLEYVDDGLKNGTFLDIAMAVKAYKISEKNLLTADEALKEAANEFLACPLDIFDSVIKKFLDPGIRFSFTELQNIYKTYYEDEVQSAPSEKWQNDIALLHFICKMVSNCANEEEINNLVNLIIHKIQKFSLDTAGTVFDLLCTVLSRDDIYKELLSEASGAIKTMLLRLRLWCSCCNSADDSGDFSKLSLDSVPTIIRKSNFSESTFNTRIDIANIDCDAANFIRGSFNSIIFSFGMVKNTNFSEADLGFVYFYDIDIEGTNFIGTSFDKIIFHQVFNIEKANFDDDIKQGFDYFIALVNCGNTLNPFWGIQAATMKCLEKITGNGNAGREPIIQTLRTIMLINHDYCLAKIESKEIWPILRLIFAIKEENDPELRKFLNVFKALFKKFYRRFLNEEEQQATQLSSTNQISIAIASPLPSNIVSTPISNPSVFQLQQNPQNSLSSISLSSSKATMFSSQCCQLCDSASIITSAPIPIRLRLFGLFDRWQARIRSNPFVKLTRGETFNYLYADFASGCTLSIENTPEAEQPENPDFLFTSAVYEESLGHINQAVKYYRKAANLGHIEAMLQIGILAIKGIIGVGLSEKNMRVAMHCFNFVAFNSTLSSKQFRIATLYLETIESVYGQLKDESHDLRALPSITR